MFRRLREHAPAALVPVAWVVVAAAHAGAVSEHALFVAHVVMLLLLVVFAVTGWAEMGDGVLRTWRAVIAAGAGATALGVAGFVVESSGLLAVALYYWMGAPAIGLLRTGRPSGAPAYLGGGVGCAVGVGVYAVTSAPILGLALVGLGQTVGIVDAVVRY